MRFMTQFWTKSTKVAMDTATFPKEAEPLCVSAMAFLSTFLPHNSGERETGKSVETSRKLQLLLAMPKHDVILNVFKIFD